jgi:dolichol kinase
MLAVFVCLVGIALILLMAEFLWRSKILQGEYQRKFIHILSGVFVASWPWLVSFRAIQLIGLAMIAVMLINRRLRWLHYLGNRKNEDYGDIFLAAAIIICALLTQNRIFFATAMAEVAIADGLAAIIGKDFGQKWRYQVFHQTKTLVGSMAFWIISLAVLGTGMLFAHDSISMGQYTWSLVIIPPLLTVLENAAVLGLDNIAVPVAAIIALQIASGTI